MDQGLNKQLGRRGMSGFGAAMGYGKTVTLQLGH